MKMSTKILEGKAADYLYNTFLPIGKSSKDGVPYCGHALVTFALKHYGRARDAIVTVLPVPQ